MKHSVLLLTFIIIHLFVFSQSAKRFQKAWIKIAAENLSQKEMEPDTLYTRYTFDKSKLYISFYPGWDDYQQEWSLNQNKLTIGFDTYDVDEITDTSLIIRLDGFRKFSFLTEDYLSSQAKYLDSIGIYNGKTLYKANKFISPRYLKGASLRNVLQKNTEGYNIKNATTFLLTFVVTEDGKVEDIKIIKGITHGFDNEIMKQLKSTSKDWKPAKYKSKAIQTEIFYEIRYLDSITR